MTTIKEPPLGHIKEWVQLFSAHCLSYPWAGTIAGRRLYLCKQNAGPWNAIMLLGYYSTEGLA